MGRRAFSLIDVLITIMVIGVLVAIMLPSLAVVKETARRVVCSSNIRQIGLGVSMFADDNDGRLPETTFVNPRLERIASETNRLRLASNSTYSSRVNTGPRPQAVWDGLGLLYNKEYLETQGIFYCPSHGGRFRYKDQLAAWDSADANIVGNFQYRGEGPDGDKRLFFIQPRRAAIVSDMIRSSRDLNHKSGINVLRADLAVFWYSDADGDVLALLSQSAQNATDQVWVELDDFVGDQRD